jgi:hypothetical protein
MTRFESLVVPFSAIDRNAAFDINRILSVVEFILAGRSSEVRFIEIRLII